ncbi:hypothetical protein F4802DRAFT_579091 [Xylaria palmicola]|nr:hypothetical protein F4802DRAFT_579091 [Xylaria palmicola]
MLMIRTWTKFGIHHTIVRYTSFFLVFFFVALICCRCFFLARRWRLVYVLFGKCLTCKSGVQGVEARQRWSRSVGRARHVTCSIISWIL